MPCVLAVEDNTSDEQIDYIWSHAPITCFVFALAILFKVSLLYMPPCNSRRVETFHPPILSLPLALYPARPNPSQQSRALFTAGLGSVWTLTGSYSLLWDISNDTGVDAGAAMCFLAIWVALGACIPSMVSESSYAPMQKHRQAGRRFCAGHCCPNT